MEIISEIIIYIFFELIFEKGIKPILSLIGIGLRWLINLGSIPFSELVKKENNGLIGITFLIILIAVLIFAL